MKRALSQQGDDDSAAWEQAAFRLLALRVCNLDFLIHSEDQESASLIEAAFSSMLVAPSVITTPVRRYRVRKSDVGRGFLLSVDGANPVELADAECLLYSLDKDLTLVFQLQRPDLYFVHAGVVAVKDRAVVISGSSGSGKSTLTLALLEDGFDYLSDELAPLDVERCSVAPFPHAVCLKSPPPAPYAFPDGTLRTGGRYHIPTPSLRTTTSTKSLPVTAFLFLRERSGSRCVHRPITPAAAAARLMSNALNLLAHPGVGLDATARLSRRAPSFELESGDLRAACRVVREIAGGAA